MIEKRWIYNFVLGSIGTILLVGFFNFIIDPYGLFRVYEKDGFNQQKEGVRTSIRHVKALEIALRKPKTIIMGSSRVHDSMNPMYEKLSSYQPVYNYGIDMARIKEIKYYLEHALKNTQIKNVFIGLDFFMFNKYERLNFTFDKSLVNREISIFDIYFNQLFSMAALKSSWATMKISYREPLRKEFLPNGYRPAKYVFYGLKNYAKLHSYTNWVFLSSRQKQTLYYAKMATDKETFDDLEEIIEICQSEKINLKLYISPAHANLDGEGILASGNYKFFEDWKRQITNITFNYKIDLYDFSGYNSVTMEKVKTPMKNYWDSSHFTENIGNKIWDVLLDNIMYIDGFGIKLLPDNIEEVLSLNRENMKSYHENNKDELRTLNKMYIRALHGKKEDTKSIQGIF
jgi:hypothetical protein